MNCYKYINTTPLWLRFFNKLFGWFLVGKLYDCGDARFWEKGYWIKNTTKESDK